MGLQKGMTNNKKGRPAGTANKVTADLRSKINAIVENQIDTIEKDLLTLKPLERLQIVDKLLSYCVPKAAQTIEVDLQNLSDAQLEQIIKSININDNE